MYENPKPDVALVQGDLIHDCPIVFWDESTLSSQAESDSATVTVVVLTQSCDLAHTKTNRILVAVVHPAAQLVKKGLLQPKLIRDQIRMHRVYGWYFLPAGPNVEESIVDLRDLHTLPRSLLEQLIRNGKRAASITTPYREHMAQHFSVTYSRIGLPEPYTTTTAD